MKNYTEFVQELEYLLKFVNTNNKTGQKFAIIIYEKLLSKILNRNNS